MSVCAQNYTYDRFNDSSGSQAILGSIIFKNKRSRLNERTSGPRIAKAVHDSGTRKQEPRNNETKPNIHDTRSQTPKNQDTKNPTNQESQETKRSRTRKKQRSREINNQKTQEQRTMMPGNQNAKKPRMQHIKKQWNQEHMKRRNQGTTHPANQQPNKPLIFVWTCIIQFVFVRFRNWDNLMFKFETIYVESDYDRIHYIRT